MEWKTGLDYLRRKHDEAGRPVVDEFTDEGAPGWTYYPFEDRATSTWGVDLRGR